MARARVAEHSKGVGRPLVGGPFSLIDHDGKPFTDANLRGRYSLVYFGFTHCPDICPEELDKMASVMDLVKAKHGNAMKSVFISCDPARDTPEVVKSYLKEFHDDMVGLTGEYEQVKQTCKTYRVYFSTPPDVKPGQDYLVDHSIYFYLMGGYPSDTLFVHKPTDFSDPEGDFVEAIGRNFTVEQAAKVINDHISDWKGKLDKS